MSFYLFCVVSYVLACAMQEDVAGCFEYYADLADGLDKQQKVSIALPMETFKTHVLKEPIGVVALITPWYLLLLFIIRDNFT